MIYLFIFIFVTVFDTCIYSLEAKKLKTVCYYTNWSQYRTGEAKFFPENIDENLCTHLIYAFAKLDGNRIIAQEWNDESTRWSKGMYERFNSLKKKNSELKTLLAIGGWNAGSGPFSRMVTTREDRREFIQSTIAYLRRWDFDGLDIDWEYPTKRGGVVQDKERFKLLLQELREAFQLESKNTGNQELLLTLAVPADKQKIDGGFHPLTIAKYADFVNVMTYDLHGAWDDYTGHNSPLYRGKHEPPGSLLNVDWVANYWKEKGVPNDKLIIGFPLYGRGFKLQDRSKTAPGSPTSGGSEKGSYTKEVGYLSYYEVCDVIQKGGTSKWIEDQKVPYLIYNGQWIGYDDARSFREKAVWLKRKKYGGAMVWALPLDDFTGRFCNEGVKFPLLRSLVSELAIPITDTLDVYNTSKNPLDEGVKETTKTTTKSKMKVPTLTSTETLITTTNITKGNETIDFDNTHQTVQEKNFTIYTQNTSDNALQLNETTYNNSKYNGTNSLENLTSNASQTSVYNETFTPNNLSNESYTNSLNTTQKEFELSTSINSSNETTSINSTSVISETRERFPMRSLLQAADTGQLSTPRPRGSGTRRGLGSVMNSLMTMLSGFSQNFRGRNRNRGRNGDSQTGSQQTGPDRTNRNRNRNQVRQTGNQQVSATNVNRNRVRSQVRQTSRRQRVSDIDRRNRIQDFPSATTVPNVIATQPVDIPIDQQQDMVPVRIGPGGQISAQSGSSRTGGRRSGRIRTSVNNGASVDSLRQINRQRTTSLRQRNLVSPTVTNERQQLQTQQRLGQSRSQNQINMNVQPRTRGSNPSMVTRQRSQTQSSRQNLSVNSNQRLPGILASSRPISERQQSQIMPTPQISQQLPIQTPIQQQSRNLQPLSNRLPIQRPQNVQQLQNQVPIQQQTNAPQILLNQPPIQRQQNVQRLLNQPPLQRPVNTPQQLLNQVPLQRSQTVQRLQNQIPLQRSQNSQQLQADMLSTQQQSQVVQRPGNFQAPQNRLSVAGQILNTEQRRLLSSNSGSVVQPNGVQQIELQIGVGNPTQAQSGMANPMANQLQGTNLMTNSIQQQTSPIGRNSPTGNSLTGMMTPNNFQSLVAGLGSGLQSQSAKLQDQGQNQNIDPATLQMLLQQSSMSTNSKPGDMDALMLQTLMNSNSKGNTQLLGSNQQQVPGLLNIGSSQSVSPMQVLMMQRMLQGGNGEQAGNAVEPSDAQENKLEQRSDRMKKRNKNVNPLLLQLLTQQMNSNIDSSFASPGLNQAQVLAKGKTGNRSQNLNPLLLPEQNMNPLMMQLLAQDMGANIGASLLNPMINTPQIQNKTNIMNSLQPSSEQNMNPFLLQLLEQQKNGNIGSSLFNSVKGNSGTVMSLPTQIQPKGKNTSQNTNQFLLEEIRKQMGIKPNEVRNTPFKTPASNAVPDTVLMKKIDLPKSPPVQSPVAPGLNRQTEVRSALEQLQKQGLLQNIDVPLLLALNEQLSRNKSIDNIPTTPEVQGQEPSRVGIVGLSTKQINSMANNAKVTKNKILNFGTAQTNDIVNPVTRVEMTSSKPAINIDTPSKQNNPMAPLVTKKNVVVNPRMSPLVDKKTNPEISERHPKPSNSEKLALQTTEDIIASRLEQKILNRLLKSSLVDLPNNEPLSSTNIEPKFQWLEKTNPLPSMSLQQTKSILHNSKPLPNLSETIGFSFLESTPPEISKMKSRGSDITALRDRVMNKIQDTNASRPTIISANSANLSPLLGNRNVSLLVIPLDGLDRHIYNILNQTRNNPQVSPVNPAPVINLVVQSGTPVDNTEVVKISDQRLQTKRPALQTIDIVTLGPTPTKPPVVRTKIVKSIKAIQSPTQIFSKSNIRVNRPKPPPIKQSEIANNTTVILNSVVPKTRTNNGKQKSNSEVLWKWQV